MSDLLENPSDRQIEKLWNDIGLNKQRIKEAVKTLKKWLQQQPHLPNEDDEVRLERFLINCKNSLEKTKATLDMYYASKNFAPDIMMDRDPNSEWFQNAYKNSYYYSASKLTQEGDRITFVGLLDPDPTNFDAIFIAKKNFMAIEVRFFEDLAVSNIIVIDGKHVSMMHLPKLTLASIRKCSILVLEAYKMRLKAVHFINFPPFAEYIVKVVKSVSTIKLAQRVHVHGSDLTEFYKHVPVHLCPTEYGGNGGSLAENNEKWKKKTESYRDWFLEQDKMKSDESKRPGKPLDSGEIFGVEGSFRKLDID